MPCGCKHLKGSALKLFAVGDNTFVCKERTGKITVEQNIDGEITQMAYHLSDDIGRLAGEATAMPRMAADERTPLEILLDGNTSEATTLYRALFESDPEAAAIAENRLNRLGYQFLGQGRPDDAIAVFRLYIALYPESANSYDSLGEALMTSGQLDDAIANYRKSLELNPANGNAVKMIEKIEHMS